MDETALTDAEMDLAQEVHAHNERVMTAALPTMDLAGALGIDLPGAEATDVDGRLSYDAGALDRAIAELDRAGTDAALALARGAGRGVPGMHACEAAVVRRREVLSTERFEARIAGIDDAAELRAVLDGMVEDRSEIESQGRHWAQDAFNAARHAGLTGRIEVAQARLAELAPSPGR